MATIRPTSSSSVKVQLPLSSGSFNSCSFFAQTPVHGGLEPLSPEGNATNVGTVI